AHGDLFNRVKLNLNGNQTETVSSQALLEQAAQSGQFTPALAEKMYDACRYLIICSTGKNPPNLQGIWTGTWQPAWSGDYTLDSNLQLEVQSIMSSNMPELMENYFTLIESWLVDSRLNAEKFYGCRGITSNPRASNTNLLLHWGNWPGEQSFGTMGWMLHFFYDYYQFTGDKVFLKDRVVPLLKENALFYEDLLKDTEDENGKYQFFISYSPEQDHYLYANSTFDIAVAKAVLTYLIKSCKLLNIEEENIIKWQTMIDKLPDYMINEKGELMEWASAGTQEVYNQRHHSHLLPLYQFCEFDMETNPQLWEASAKALEGKTENWLHNRKNADSNHITHGMMNQAQAAARLGKSDIVYEVLSRLATEQYIYPSFMMSYWPKKQGYGFDPIGTIPDVINNALAFAWEDVVDIIPALPKEWSKGSINNILLRGQIQIDALSWNMETGELKLKMTSKADKAITIRLPEKYEVSTVKSGESELEPIQGEYKNKWQIELSQNKPKEIVFNLK
uniref:glycosyl hydrolase family 95 catalytic domain-containing protein n=1 Tax=uncultured Wocania sp. TaxID=2834404 RepID=UPI0030FB0B4C